LLSIKNEQTEKIYGKNDENITVTANGFIVYAAFFKPETDYTVTYQISGQRFGSISKKYTTKSFKFGFQFGVNPY
jgi:hypothetical protein